MESLLRSAVYKKDLSEYGQILVVEFSPYVLSQDLILIGFERKVLLGHVIVDEQVVDFKVLAEFADVSRCCGLTMSPETSINILPNTVIFAAVGADFKLRVFRGDLRSEYVCEVLSDHTNYINEAQFDSEGNFLASVSDDNTAKLFETDKFACVATLQLTSPGMSVCWHRDSSSKLMIAEKIGLIRFYNVETLAPILSLDYGKPLTSAHWAPSDPHLVASLQLGDLVVWNLTNPCVPNSSNLLFTEAGGHIKFSPFGELIASVNSLENSLKVVHVQNSQLKLFVPLTLPTKASWHCRCPIIAAGDYMTLNFFRVPSK